MSVSRNVSGAQDDFRQGARFNDWRHLDFEMAYLPSPNDYLKWALGPNYQAGPHDVPYAGKDGNSIVGRMYGTNNIRIVNDIPCTPFINSCSPSFQANPQTRAGPGNTP